jgi:tetratricopeptide (TPR) repeat protein
MQKFQIDASTWVTLNRLLDEALEQPATQLPQWLDELAPEFDGLKARLRELLARTGLIETGEFLHTLPKFELEPGDLASAPPRVEQPGQEIGLYRLVRELGSGGMGVVWLAERTDGLINRPVALKLPHGAWKRAGLAERMAREREILATLTHPNIAHLYDAGLTPDGQPYLAIEYVEGLRIDVYCREQELDVRARLKLFAQVAKAVAYAHGKLVVHRDLKPANILVSAEGQARLLDFGIAKLLEEGQAKETRFTEISGRALTPEYASPEQILGEPLTIASDVYSLGVILYELLSGHRPYKLQRDSRGALEDAIVAADPAQPSDAADGPSRKSLRGDLDTIVLKALKKKPAERYPTVHALLDDIERYLDARPVLAQPDSRRYRARKFIARNKVAVSAGAAIALAILAGAALTAWQARVALAEQRRAEEVKEFIAAVFREADFSRGQGKILTAPELLRQAELRLAERPDASPAMRLELLTLVGESLLGLQEYRDSARVLADALRLQQSLDPPDFSLEARLRMALTEALAQSGKYKESRAELVRVFELLGQHESGPTPMYVRAKLHEAAFESGSRQFAVAEAAAAEAMQAATAVFGAHSAEAANARLLLGQVQVQTGRTAEAVSNSRGAFEQLLSHHGGDLAHPKVMDAAQHHQTALMYAGDFDGAATLGRNLADRVAEVAGSDSRMAGDLRAMTAAAELERGDLRAAIDEWRLALAILRKETDPEGPPLALRVRALGNALVTARANAEAVEQLAEGVRLAQAAQSPVGEMQARSTLGLALARVGRFDTADIELRTAVSQAPPGTRVQFLAMRNLGTMLRLRGRYAESLEWLDKGTAGLATKRVFASDLALGLVDKGLAHLDLGELPAADESFARAEAKFAEFQKDRMTPARADLLVGMARVAMQERRYSNALPQLQAADDFWKNFDPSNRDGAEAARRLGRCLLALERGTEAQNALTRAARLDANVALLELAR